MSLFPYLTFNGTCRQAIDLYAEIFGADKSVLSTYGEAPPSPDYTLPEDAKHLVLHAELVLHGNKIMLSDTFTGSPVTMGNNIGLAFVLCNIEEIQRAFACLSEGGTVVMALQETFWTKCYGSVIDRFGILWHFNLAE